MNAWRAAVAVGVLVAGLSPCRGAVPPPAPGATDEDLLHDWLLQDHGADVKNCFASKSSAEAEAKLIARVAGQLGPAGEPFARRRKALRLLGVPGADPQWKALYVAACRARRAKRLAPLLEKYKRLVFTKHYDLGGSHYAYTEGLSDAQAERHFRPGTALCVLELDAGGGTVRTLIDDPKGVIRDPDVSYDGRRILFAWKKSDRQDDYHLYEMDAATGRVRQLTEGLGYADYEAAYLPNGQIVFNSTRCVQTVDCWWTEVSNLYFCDGDGRFLRRASFDQVHTNYPTVTDDGRILYTRWDYNDRGQLFPQPLFQMNLDGTGQTEVYGNNSWFPTTIMHARQIPGTQKILAVLSGHHTRQKGKLGIIDPTVGTQEASGVRLVAPVRETKAVRIDAYGQRGEQWQYPYPIDERNYIVTYRPEEKGPHGRLFGLYWQDIDGRRELLARDGRISCNQPVPLAPRRQPHVRPSAVDYARPTGTYYVRDVYIGPGLKGVERGTVKRLRVVALEFRAAGVGSNGNGGPAGGALVSTPVAVRNGTWDVKRVLGSTPVHEDGSAMFLVPARTPVYFQLLDATGRVVQSMRSWSTLQPGETFSCVGCHEAKGQAAPSRGYVPTALRSGAKPLEPFYGPARGFSFPREIQPILDRHCIRCHKDRTKRLDANRRPSAAAAADAPAEAKAEKLAFSLLGETTVDKRAKRAWSDSYLALTQNGRPNRLVNWLNVQSIPPMLPPYFAGSAKSELLTMLEKGHNGVKLTREEYEKIACWIDLLVPYCGDYTEANAWSEAEKAKYARFQAKREAMAELDRRNIQTLLAQKAGKTAAVRPAPAAGGAYRNVALNPDDVQGPAKGYPHASSNSEYRGMAAFAARCAIDGRTDNRGHGRRFPSWGPEKRKDLWWKVEFGRAVKIDKVVLYIRADFPHDRHWHSATLAFSDGSRESISIRKTAEPQTFTFAKRTVTWMKITDLVQDEPPGWCGLTEVQVWGRDAGEPAAAGPR